MRTYRNLLNAVLLVSASVAEPASAADGVVTVDTVPVLGIRNPQEFSYDSRRDERFNSVPAEQRDKIRLSYYVQGRKAPVSLEGLRLDVESGGDYLPVDILRSGEFKLPSIPSDKLAEAKVVANVPEGALSIIYKVDVVPPASPMSMGYLREALVQSKAGWKRAYGNIFAGMTVPDFTCAKFEFLTPASVMVSHAGKTLWASAPDKVVQVPLTASIPPQAVVSYDRGALARIGGCKLGRSE